MRDPRQIRFTARKPIPVGTEFTRLKTLGSQFRVRESHGRPQSCVVAECECGSRKVYKCADLRTGNTRSCGCLLSDVSADLRRTHGCAGTRLHRIWKGMRQRCQNPRDAAYRHYGGRGITVCDEWSSFEAFKTWAEDSGYSDNLEIDRIDVNGSYEPSNCRWADDKQQSRNTRVNHILAAFGESKCIADWADDPRCSVSRRCIESRIRLLGWDPEDAIKTPKLVNQFSES